MFCDGCRADLVIGFELVTFCNPRTWSVEIFTALRETEPYVAFLPMGLMLIIPLRNSTKVPLVTVNKRLILKDSVEVSYRLIGMSRSAI